MFRQGYNRLRYWKYRFDLAVRNYRDDPEGYGKISFSQEGEDRLLMELFAGKETGFYVDVGAHHPIRFSNTYAFYLRGWRGINIDATPGSMEPFFKFRPLDTNLESAVSDGDDTLTFHILNEPGMNTFDSELARHFTEKLGYKIVETKTIRPRRLASILDESLPKGQSIDFMDVDVEGFDLRVLKSNDWQKYRPTILLVENFTDDLAAFLKSEANLYLEEQGYHLRCRGLRTSYYQANESRDTLCKI